MTGQQRVVAVGLLTEQDLSVLGQGFRRLYRLDGSHDFTALLSAIDEADRALDHAAPAAAAPARVRHFTRRHDRR